MRLPLPTNKLVSLTLASAIVAAGVAVALASSSPTATIPDAPASSAPAAHAPSLASSFSWYGDDDEGEEDEDAKHALEAQRHAADEADER